MKRIVAHEQFTLSLRRCLLNALESNVEQRRIFAAELSSMWKGNDGALVAQLVKGLASPNDRLFNASLLAVRAIRPPQAIRNLSACLEDRKLRTEFRSSCVSALFVFDRTEEMPLSSLRAVILNDPSPAIRCDAAIVLGKFAEGHREQTALIDSVASLLDQPSGQPHSEGSGPKNLQECGVLALRELGPVSKEVYAKLITVFAGSQEPSTVNAAALSLSTIAGFYQDAGMTQMLPLLQQAEKALEKPAKSLDSEVRHGIGMHARHVRRARKHLEDTRDHAWQQRVIAALGPAAVPAGVAAGVFLTWGVVFVVYPAGLLAISRQLKPIDSLSLFGVNVRLLVEYLTLLRIFLYRRRVLNQWVCLRRSKQTHAMQSWSSPVVVNGD
ncbi:MAG TPA: hypothetical protein VER03_18085, partial [Bryobacteraceae bacterium]|nr:hypothetical protein [Bryobacteraceae bacterium]